MRAWVLANVRILVRSGLKMRCEGVGEVKAVVKVEGMEEVEAVSEVEAGGGSSRRSKPRRVAQMEEDLRAALILSFCSPSTVPYKVLEEGLRAVEASLRQLVGIVRPYNTLLTLLHHGYTHHIHHLQTRLANLQTLLENNMSYGCQHKPEVTRLSTLNSDLHYRLQDSDLLLGDLKNQVFKLEELLGEERRRGQCLEDETRRLEGQLLEVITAVAVSSINPCGSSSTRSGRCSILHLEVLDEHINDQEFNIREELSEKTRLLHDIERQYRDVVPRADYDRQQRRLTTLSNAHKQLSHAHDMLKDQHDALLGVYEAAVTERDELSAENHTLRRAATPRPDWNRAAEYVEGGISRWRELSCGKNSDQLVDVLISELTGSQLSTSSEFIDCKGVEESVPVYLRYEGSVRNRRLGKRDVSLVIDDIWREKRRLANKDPMDEFVDSYFKERYHMEEVRAEWCYSLADACQRLAYEEQIGLFWGILCGQVQEQVYHHQVDSVNNLYDVLKSRDPEDKGVVSRGEVEAAIRQVFPLKSESNVKVLMETAARASSLKDPTVIKYHNLFSQGSTGTRTGLVTEVTQQARDEQDAYIQEVLDELGYAAMDVSVNELSRAFTIVDPRIEQRELDAYLEWIFNTTKNQLKSTAPIPLPLLAARLQTGHIVRVGARS
ncbi:translin-associated factor X-interacting protein 1-like [Cherax quadricarinatus]|uniref:translin-associated factor X-interacting protein 1-like n=1 Tax=Cherax quadricarinatus TaxID=27406 RepID=UPI00387E4CE6